MIDYARAIGLAQVHGQVLAENTTMLRMCAELGFGIEDDPTEKGIKVVRLEVRSGHEGRAASAWHIV